MIYDLARADRAHHALANMKPGPILVPKRCACGKAVHAKLLVQQEKCDACALTEGVDVNDLEMLRHAVGAIPKVYPKSSWGFRNHYIAGDDDIHAMRRLQAAGLVRAGIAAAGLFLFHATRKGCRAVKLGPKAIDRALGVAA